MNLSSPLTEKLLNSTKTCQLALAGFSLPNQSSFTFYIQLLDKTDGMIKNKEYWFHPFQVGEHKPFVRIQPHFICDEQQLPEEIQNRLNHISETDFWQRPSETLLPTQKEKFIDSVNKVKTWIKNKRLEKMALSVLREAILPSEFSILKTLHTLRSLYPQTFISYISTPYTGTWLGATPEILLHQHQQQGETVSLAGTKLLHEKKDWGEKERIEQDIVTRFINEEISSVIHGTIKQEGPHTLAIGNLLHLQTKFRFDFNVAPDVKEILQLALRLHPTPAVGTYPKQMANIIQDVELHDRLYYAGFTGPVDTQASHLFVNLRCLMLVNDSAYIYSGAGITADSNPEDEWLETENKALSIQHAFKP